MKDEEYNLLLKEKNEMRERYEQQLEDARKEIRAYELDIYGADASKIIKQLTKERDEAKEYKIRMDCPMETLAECLGPSDKNSSDDEIVLEAVKVIRELEKEVAEKNDYCKKVWKTAHAQYQFDLEVETSRLQAQLAEAVAGLEKLKDKWDRHPDVGNTMSYRTVVAILTKLKGEK